MVARMNSRTGPSRLKLKQGVTEIVTFGRLLFERRLVTGWGGNISLRISADRILITGRQAPLGFLKGDQDVVLMNLKGKAIGGKGEPSSELALHLAIYQGTEARAVIHAHPPAVMGLPPGLATFAPESFEEKYYLGEVPVFRQETPTVTKPGKIIELLKKHKVIIIEKHGSVAIGKTLQEAFLLTDLLEEALRTRLLFLRQ